MIPWMLLSLCMALASDQENICLKGAKLQWGIRILNSWILDPKGLTITASPTDRRGRRPLQDASVPAKSQDVTDIWMQVLGLMVPLGWIDSRLQMFLNKCWAMHFLCLMRGTHAKKVCISQPDAEVLGSRGLPYSCLISAVTQWEVRSAVCKAEPTHSCQNGPSLLCSRILIFLTLQTGSDLLCCFESFILNPNKPATGNP